MKYYIDIVLEKAKKSLDIDEIIKRVEELLRREDSNFSGLSSDNLLEIKDVILDGINNYEYFQFKDGNIRAFNKTSYRKGSFIVGNNGEYKVAITSLNVGKGGKSEVYFIEDDSTNGAIDGDSVLIEKIPNSKSAKVIKIISRNFNNIVGEVCRDNSQYFVRPVDERKNNLRIYIDGPVVEGQLVNVFLKEQTGNNSFLGEVMRVYDRHVVPGEDILSEAIKNGVPNGISRDSENELSKIKELIISRDELNKRVDYTLLKTFTIDGESTEDFDDAISIYEENGHKVVIVHISHVSYFVPFGSALFRDAYKKGNSYYLGGKVIPMIPYELSNDICSLRPGVDRLTISCKMTFNDRGDIIDYDIIPSVINSDLRMTYSNVNKVLNGKSYPLEYNNYVKELKSLNDLAVILKNKRESHGALNFEKPELRIIYDDSGKAVDFGVRVQDSAENLIEEFMIVTNETVSKHLTGLGLPCLYRVHDGPNKARLGVFLDFLKHINLPLDSYDVNDYVTSPQNLQSLYSKINDLGNLSIALNPRLVRCMSKAKYSPDNIGHFGLEEEEYLHFTSPNRRLADLIIQCFLDEFCFKTDLSNVDYYRSKLQEFGRQASKMEKISDGLERIVRGMKCSEYMQEHIGEEYIGTAIELSDKCMVVQLDNLIEGRVLLKNLSGSYKFDKNNYTLLSLGDEDDFYIGDRLKLMVIGASKDDKTIDFTVLEKMKDDTKPLVNNGYRVYQKI